MSIFNQLNIAQQESITVALCTIIESQGSTPRKPGTKMIVYSNGEIYGSIGGGAFEHQVIQDALKTITNNNCSIFNYAMKKEEGMSCGGKATVFIEPLIGKSKLYIFGGGHIGKILSELTTKLGFAVFVIDERPEIIETLSKNNGTLICKPYNDAINNLIFDKNTFISIATHNHLYDKEIVAYCAKQSFAYLGMLGSKNKINNIKSEFLENKILSKNEMNKIDWPMGVKIACNTPEEIAVSILAKLVDVRTKLSTKSG